MKKVLIIVAGLFGAALLTTSCVETQESATVTAMREAKLAQLQALAQQAQYQAQQDSIQAAIDRATSAAEIEALLLQQQYNLLNWQYQMQQLQYNMENAANQNVLNLYNAYMWEVHELNDLKSQLNQQNAFLAQYENQLITTEQSVAAQVATYQNNIERAKVKLEAYQKYLEFSYDELVAEANRLTVEQEMASNELLKANAARFEALSAKDELLKPYGDYNPSSYTPTVDKESHRMLIAMDSLYKLSQNPLDVFGTEPITQVSYMEPTTVTFNDDRFEEETGNTDFKQTANYVNAITIGIYAITPESILQTRLDIKESIGVPSVESQTSPIAATNLYAGVENAEEALKNAKDALVTAQKGDDEQAIIDAQKNVNIAERDLADAQEKLNNALKAQSTFDRLADEVAVGGEAYKAYEAEINALGENEVLVAYFDACAAHDEANDNYIEVSGQKNVAEKIKEDSKDMEQEILQLEQNIALWEKNIEDLAGNVTIHWQYDSNGYTVGFYISGNGQNFYAILLEQVNNYIANLTEQIALQEEIVALAKAALDAALAGESTPAE